VSFTRLLVFAVAVSAGLWTLGLRLMEAEKPNAYAALVCGEDVPDRDIRERLENQGFSGMVSESGQLVLLDCFGSLEQISLDEYPSRVLPFDPRNDGYAEKLRSLFVRDGRRYVYIPLALPQAKLPLVEKKLAAALGDIPYALEYGPSGGERRTGFSLILFFFAVCSFFIVRPLRLELKPKAACLVPCLLALSPLVPEGAAGFALASLLAGSSVLAAALCLERPGLPRIWRWLLPPLLLTGYGLIAFFSGLPLVFTMLVLILFCITLAFSLRFASRAAAGFSFKRRDTGHQRFSPVLILKRRSSGFAFSWAMLPFAASALILACSGLAASVSMPQVPPVLPSAADVTEADYIAHCLFQSTFSQRPLHKTNVSAASDAAGMSVYELSPDGLLAQTVSGESSKQTDMELPAGLPPFPLNDFYLNINTSERAAGLQTLLLALFPLLYILPALKFKEEFAPDRMNRQNCHAASSCR
jgi:hypothetical protein